MVVCKHCGKRCRLCQKCHKKSASYGNPSDGALHCKICKDETDKVILKAGAACITCKERQKSFGPFGGLAVHCGKCKEDGDVLIGHQYCITCTENGQNTVACYALPGEKPKYCTQHKPSDAYVDVKNAKCIECKTRIASYELNGKLIYCATCAKTLGIYDQVRNGKVPYCIICNKFIATFGIDKPLYCNACRDPTKHKDVRSKMCEVCNLVQANYGPPGQYPSRCIKCKRTDDKVTRRGCECGQSTASYGQPGGKPIHCSNCKKEGEINLFLTYYPCTACGLIMARHEDSECDYCNPDSAHRTYEKDVAYFLKTMLLNKHTKILDMRFNSSWEIGKNCGAYRPDIVIDCTYYFIIIEIDENQHKYYDKNCDMNRTNNIMFSLGLPVIFIRYNPSSYVNKDGQKMDTPAMDRKAQLLQCVEQILENETVDPDILHLFYDEKVEKKVETQQGAEVRVAAFNKNNECVGKYESIAEAARDFKSAYETIRRAVLDSNASACGYKWRKFPNKKDAKKDGVDEFEKLSVVTQVIVKEPNRGKRIAMMDSEGKPVAVFTSGMKAAEALGLSKKSILDVVDKPTRTSCGFSWKTVDKNVQVTDELQEQSIALAKSKKLEKKRKNVTVDEV